MFAADQKTQRALGRGQLGATALARCGGHCGQVVVGWRFDFVHVAILSIRL
jgi:hypothetical protein